MRLKRRIRGQNSGSLKYLISTMALLITFAIVLIGFGLKKDVVLAADSGNFNNVSWTLDENGCLTFTGSGWISPPYGYEFSGRSDIISIVIGNDITGIGSSAFKGCPNLTSVFVEADGKLSEISVEAFACCHKLSNVTLPDGLYSIKASSFTYCEALETLTLPSGLTELGEGAFAHCKLRYINFQTDKLNSKCNTFAFDHMGEGITEKYVTYKSRLNTSISTALTDLNYTEISEPTVYNLGAMVSSDIKGILCPDNRLLLCGFGSTKDYNNNVLATQSPLFRNTNITSVLVSGGISNLGNGLFQDCTKIANVTFETESTNLGNYVFRNCASLRGITLSPKITSLGDYAFGKCYYLESIAIPASLEKIGSFCFWQCDKLSNVTIENSINNRSKLSIIGASAFQSCKGLTSIVLPNSVQDIESSAFASCINLQGFIFPDKVTNISNYVLGECRNLLSVTINGRVTKIEDQAFKNCEKLASISIPGFVKEIGLSAFENCDALKSVTLPSSVTSLGMYAFRSCSNLQTFVMTNNVTSIGKGLFEECRKLVSVTLSDNLTSIEESVFDYCINLAKVTIPDSVTRIKKYAFFNCTNLKSIRLPLSVTSIELQAFSGCWSLDTVDVLIDDTPTTRIIDPSAFSSCGNNIHFDFFDKNGVALSGSSLTAAYDLYKSYPDSDTTDNYLHGITIAPYNTLKLVAKNGDNISNHYYKEMINLELTPSMLPTGYEFYGWNTSPDYSGDFIIETASYIMPAADVTLYACYIPTGVTGIGISIKNATDGKLQGTTEEMEYRLSSQTDNDYKPCSKDVTENLAPGTYLVRFTADQATGLYASKAITVAIVNSALEPSPTPTPTATPTPTPTATPAPTPTATPAPTPEVIPSDTLTVTPTVMPSVTPTPYIINTEIIDVKAEASAAVINAPISVKRTTDSNGKITDNATYNENQAKETIEKLKEKGNDVACIVMPDNQDKTSETSVTIPSTSLEIIANSNTNLEIVTNKAKIAIPKESLQNADKEMKEALIFHMVPLNTAEEKEDILDRVKQEKSIQLNIQYSPVSIIGTPMIIETNIPHSDIEITLPIDEKDIPANEAERNDFLSKIAVYIEHSDGEKEILKGKIVEYKDGTYGIQIGITKFSTFTIIQADTLVDKSSDCEIIKCKVPSGTKINNSKLSATVNYSVTKTIVNVTVSKNASWDLYSDAACTKKIKSKSLKLNVGSNKAYIKVFAEDGKTTKTYTITIKRKAKVTKK